MSTAAESATDPAQLDKILTRLQQTLEQRRAGDPQQSYVAGLYAQGLEAILAKVEEESTEVLDAARSGDDAHLIHEVADLWFHTLVMLVHRNLSAQQVLTELASRFGISGLDEKASR